MSNTGLDTTHSSRRVFRWALIGAILLMLTLVLSGCAGGGPTALGNRDFQNLGKDMAAIEQMKTSADLDARDAVLRAEFRRNDDKVAKARIAFLRGYLAEYRESLGNKSMDSRDYADASTQYNAALKGGGGYAAQAHYRLGVLGASKLLDDQSLTTAKNNLQQLTRSGKNVRVWVREPEIAGEGGSAVVSSGTTSPAEGGPVFVAEEATIASVGKLDKIYQTAGGLDAIYYRVVRAYVNWFKGITPSYGAALSLIFLALIIKLITTPLTTASFRGMRDMQRVQPLLKELQEKYKDDKAKLAEAQMNLMKEHKVSPLGGCLPMLIQLPIFIVVYRAVQVYAAGFTNAPFIWIKNLAEPDLILLILYALSMIVTQKLTATPATDPQQKMMQQQMTYMMPIFLLFVLQSIASAFVLYWFFLNVFSAIHQYYLVKKFQAEDEAMGRAIPAPTPAPSKKKKGN